MHLQGKLVYTLTSMYYCHPQHIVGSTGKLDKSLELQQRSFWLWSSKFVNVNSCAVLPLLSSLTSSFCTELRCPLVMCVQCLRRALNLEITNGSCRSMNAGHTCGILTHSRSVSSLKFLFINTFWSCVSKLEASHIKLWNSKV